MRVIIVGCGRVGSALALRLTAEGHDTWVIDRRAQAGQALPDGFTGHFIEGNGYNRAVLDAAGITHADALVAVTDRDNGNIVTARVARQTYRVPVVLARIDDPRRAETYRGLGIRTISSVSWTVHRLHQLLLHRHLAPERGFGNGETLLIRSGLPDYLTGRPLSAFEVDGEIRVAEVTRGGHSLVPSHHTLAERGDVVTFTVAASALGRLRGFLDKELGT
ncbi:TrkA family potassium uptake protein [Actinacidiphila glaucinigra]|uniref:potassium channel family protein n=1 Tax=Actinacidiphila glaucinigra TaxID=235986 RepID=UPI002DDBD371|nr:TrkA family potassium uptake protein [Actinacidiphila glaucinigra]WSD64983.1 TrkA family potassium uptake protein [Actinacidiphila glaucinigra]